MNEKAIIVYESIYHENTRKLAVGMGIELNCKVVTCEQAKKIDLSSYEVVGLGSGIYFTSHHPELLNVAEKLDQNQKVFIFSTRGRPFLGNYHQTLKDVLVKREVELIGEYSCKGYDCTGPYNLVHGGNVGHPNESDVRKARKYVHKITQRYFPELDNDLYRIQELRNDKKHVGIDVKRCRNCGACQKVCMMNVFTSIDGKTTVNEENCIHCGKCMEVCPQNAISLVHSSKELIHIAKKHAKRTCL